MRNKIVHISLLVLFLVLLFPAQVYGISKEQRRLFDSGVFYFDANVACIQSPATPTGNKVYLLGDSWLVGMMATEPSITTQLANRGITVLGANGVIGRSINNGGQGGGGGGSSQSALDAIEQDQKLIMDADKVVIVLGTNPDSYDRSIPRLIQGIGKQGNQVYWVNTSANAGNIVDSANQANRAIHRHQGIDTYQVINWFNVAFPGGDPENIDIRARSPLMSSDRLHPNNSGTSELIDLIVNTITNGTTTGLTTDMSSRGSLPQIAIERMAPYEERIETNRPVYERLAAKHQLSWQVFATIHIREAGADPNRSMLGGEVLGTKAVDSDNTPQTLEESGDLAAEIFKGNARSVYDIEISPSSSTDDLKHAFLAYNRGFLYKRVPTSEGGPWPPDKSPYVMNLLSSEFSGPDGSGMIFPGGGTVDGRRWGEPGHIRGSKNSVPGAMAILAYLGISLPGSGDSCGSILSASDMVWPVVINSQPAGRVTACWGDHRQKMVSGGSYYHSGIDIGAAEGTDILAVKQGRVVFSGINRSYGYMVVIEHSNGIWSHYGHMVRIEEGIEENVTVSAGQKIGEVGNTGVSLGAHLHLNIYTSWPFGALPDGAASSNGKETVNPLTRGLIIPSGIDDIPGCTNYPSGGRKVQIDL